MKDLNKNFENLEYVLPPYYDGELAQVVCLKESSECEEEKHISYFLDKNGNIVATFDYKHADIEQLSKYRDNIFIFRCDSEKYCYQNTYKIIRAESNGTHSVFGEYDYIEYGEENFTFAVQKNGKYGFINIEGELIIDCQYDSYVSFVNGFAIVQLNGKWGMIDKENNIILPFIYSDNLYNGIYKSACHWKDSDGNLTFLRTEEDYKCGLVSKTGEQLIKCKYDVFYPIGENAIIAKLEDKFGLIDIYDNVLLPFIYDDIGGYEQDKLCVARKDDLYGLIDKKGNFVYPLGKEPIEDMGYDGVYKIQEYNEDKKKWDLKTGFIDETGKLIIPIEYYNYYRRRHFIGGYCVVENKQGQNLVINKKNEIVFKNEYKRKHQDIVHKGSIENLGYGLFLVETEQNIFKLYKVED